MRVLDLSGTAPHLFRRPYVTIGFFDGFHVGHTTVLSRLVGWAASRGGEAVVLTFRRHPKSVVAGSPPLSIMCTQHRLLWFRRLLIDAVVLMEFDDEMAAMEAERFVDEVLVKRIGVKGMLFGWDSRFGLHGRGTAEMVRRGPWNIEVRSCPPVEVDSIRPSSTLIRRFILEGRLEKAARLLGHHHTLWGRVVEGEGIGRRLGVPTINLSTEAETLPPDGVYGGRAVLPDSSAYWALINIGHRPTFGRKPRTVEAHLLGFSGNLYGHNIELEIHRFIRPIRPFPDGKSLKAQIERDIKAFLVEARLAGRAT